MKEFAKTGQDSDAVSGLIAYTSHNENEIYTIVIFPPESIKKCKSVKCCNCIFQISVICNRPFIIQPVQNLCCKTIAVINGIDFIF